MSIIMAAKSWLLSQPSSLLYTKTKCPIISNYVNPSFKLLQNTSFNNSSTISHSLSLTTRRRRTRHSSFLTFAVDEFGFENPDPYENLDVFVENLPEGIEFEALFEVFQQVVVGAEITNGDVPSQKYATVNMKTVEEVEKAMNKFSGYDLNGKLLTISREKPKREQPKPPTKASRL